LPGNALPGIKERSERELNLFIMQSSLSRGKKIIGNRVLSVLLLTKLFIPWYTSMNKNFSERSDESCYLDNSRQKELC